MSRIVLPYRCRICDQRLFKFSWMKSTDIGASPTRAAVPAWEWKAEPND